jgi:hypothetical protein
MNAIGSREIVGDVLIHMKKLIEEIRDRTEKSNEK